MKNKPLLICLLIPNFIFGTEHPANSGAPTQAQKAEVVSSFKRFPKFPQLDIVKNGQGDPALVSVIENQELRNQIEAGELASLQVFDLEIESAAIYYVGTVIHDSKWRFRPILSTRFN
jgi:hypothetical protein